MSSGTTGTRSPGNEAAFNEPVAGVRDQIMNAVVAKGVPCFSGSCSEVYLEKAFTSLGLGPEERLPVAKALGESSLMFLVHPTLTEAEIDKTCEVLRKVMSDVTS